MIATPQNCALVQGDALAVLKTFAPGTVRCCVTSPPYYSLRDYGVGGQLGLEQTPDEYVERLVEVLEEVRRVLTDDGTLWLNLGDSYVMGPPGSRDPDRWPIQSRQDHVPRAEFEDTCGSSDAGTGRGKRPPVRKSFPGCKPKDLIGIPWMVALDLRARGWYLRQDIVWGKSNPLPESVEDRFTRAHEFVFLLSKSPTYYFDFEAVKEPAVGSWRGSTFNKGKTGASQIGAQSEDKRKNSSSSDSRVVGFQDRWDASDKPELRRKRDVWHLSSKPYKGAHFAVMLETLVDPCVLAGSAHGDIVLDPFCGSGTVGVVALRHGRSFVGIDLNPEYLKLAEQRISASQEGAA